MIDPKHIGKELPPLTVEIEKGRLRFFAQAIGETNPIYFDEAAARAAGYRSLPAPPTYVFSIDLEQPDPFGVYIEMGINFGRMLHGEQSFKYYAPICAGDRITLKSRIADVYSKKNGALDFIVKETVATNQDGVKVVEAKTVIVGRNA